MNRGVDRGWSKHRVAPESVACFTAAAEEVQDCGVLGLEDVGTPGDGGEVG